MLRKFLFFIIFLLFVLAASFGSLVYQRRDAVLKYGLETWVMSLTGFKTTVERLHYEYPNTIDMRGVRMLNPPGFAAEVFGDATYFDVQLNIPALIKGEKCQFYDIKIHLTDLDIEKTAEGISNVGLLKAAFKKKKDPNRPDDSPGSRFFYLDRLELSLDHVTYRNETVMLPKKISAEVHVEKEVFYDLPDLWPVVDFIQQKIIYTKTVGTIETGADKIQEMMKNSLTMGGGLLKGTSNVMTEKAGGVVKQTTVVVSEKSGTLMEEAKQRFAQAAGTAKEQLSGLIHKMKSTVQGGSLENRKPQVKL